MSVFFIQFLQYGKRDVLYFTRLSPSTKFRIEEMLDDIFLLNSSGKQADEDLCNAVLEHSLSFESISMYSLYEHAS